MKVYSKIATGLAIAAASMATQNALAYETGDIILRVGSATVAPDADSDEVKAGGDVLIPSGGNVDVDDATALGISGTYMFSPKFGIEILAASPFEHDLETDGGLKGATGLNDIGRATHLPPTLSLQWYPMGASGSAIQPYLGAGINYTIFWDEELDGGVKDALGASNLDLENSVGYAVSGGLDWNINEKWLVNFSVMYIDLETEAQFNSDLGKVEVDVDVDPMVYRLNVGYKF